MCVIGFASITVGDLRFETADEYTTGGGSTGIFAADFDGDLDIALAVANRASDSVTILYNNGFGIFENIVDFPTGENPRYVEGHDFDGDGDVDLCTPDYYGMTTTILENDGNGVFSISQQFQMLSPSFLWIDDLDLDGHKDIATLHWDQEAGNPETSPALMTPIYSNGDGTFKVGSSALVGVQPRSAASGDLNGDGLIDIVVADIYSRTISIVLATGPREWSNSFQISTWPRTPRYISLGDFDGDDDIDFASLDKLGNHFSIFKNDGNASFTLDEIISVSDTPHSMVTLDVDSDNDLDFIVTHVGSNIQKILYNDGSGQIEYEQSITIIGGAAEVKTADFNSDGMFDIAVATVNQSHPGASILTQIECLGCKGGDPCPPSTSDVNLESEYSTVVKVQLIGESTTENTLEYIIKSLPQEGELKDSNGQLITSVPYYLPSNILTYIPDNGFSGLAYFYYLVNDCSPSNVSIVTIQVNPIYPDECNTSRQIFNGYTSIFTSDATDSIDYYDSSQCDDSNLGEMRKDIWLSYYACESGELLIDTCGLLDFDSDIVVYEDRCCNLNQVACNGDTVGCNGNTVITIGQVESDVEYFIRIGGAIESSSGSGIIYVEGPSVGCTDVCRADINFDDVVNVSDLLFVIAQWGSFCTEADINGDEVVNVVDLLEVIGVWGPCEE